MPRSPSASLSRAPVEPSSLRHALDGARAPGAARAEVDALLRVLARPLGPGEDARARADLLHHILGDKRTSAFTGSNGRRVAHAVVEALEALGYPYALEVPPELLAETRAASVAAMPGGRESTPPKPARDGKGWFFLLLGYGVGFVGLRLTVEILEVMVASKWNSLVLLFGGPQLLGGLVLLRVGVGCIRRSRPQAPPGKAKG